jgi:hypothetical protein
MDIADSVDIVDVWRSSNLSTMSTMSTAGKRLTQHRHVASQRFDFLHT